MLVVRFTNAGADQVTYGPFESVKVGMAEIYAPFPTTEGYWLLAKVYGDFSYNDPAGIIVTDGITVTGADNFGTDLYAWVPFDSPVGYTDVIIEEYIE